MIEYSIQKVNGGTKIDNTTSEDMKDLNSEVIEMLKNMNEKSNDKSSTKLV